MSDMHETHAQLGALLLPLAADWLTAATAVAVGLFVATLVSALFGQRGHAGLTPQREAALLTGHADRRSVFEMPLLQPLMWLLLALVERLGMKGIKKAIRAQLIAAGSPSFYTTDEFLAVCLLWGIGLALGLEIITVLFSGQLSLLVLAIGFVLGTSLSVYWLVTQAAKRVRQIGRGVPYTLDLISLAMGAGATFTEAIRTVVREDPNHPFNVELSGVLAEMELGSTREQALKNLADRIPLENLRSIIAAVIQAEGLGSPLSEVLKQQADLLRLQRSVRAEKLAASASVRILLPGLLILMSVVLAVFAPLIILAIKGKLMG